MSDQCTMDKRLDATERAIARLFYDEHFNTAQIARKLRIKEWIVDNLLHIHMQKRFEIRQKSRVDGRT